MNMSGASKLIATLAVVGTCYAGPLGEFKRVGASFTRPADTTAYASGDLVANSTTAGSVVPVSLNAATRQGGQFRVDRIKLHKSTTTTTNASFRVHLYATATITFANGDNAAWSTNQVANYLGSFDITVDKAFTDGASGVVITGLNAISLDSGWLVAAVVEARAAYAPGNAEVFTVTLESAGN